MPTASPLLAPIPTVRRIKHPTWSDHYFTFLGMAEDINCNIPLKSFLNDENAIVADVHRFAAEPAGASIHYPMPAGEIEAPDTTLLLREGTPGGVQIRALSGIESRPLRMGGRVIGRYFEDCDAKYCILGDVRPGNPAASPAEQTQNVLDTIQEALAGVGMDFRNVVRTWFFNDRILDWYAEFNRVRSTFFQRHGIALMPASTGIGGSNAGGTALVAKAIAVLPKTEKVTIRRVESPLQCEASNYGSAFSRALEVADPAARMLYVSGTASIEPGGETAHMGNASKQIEKTMEVIDTMLARNGMSLADIVRAIGYFRHREHIPLWRKYCRTRDVPPIPIILTESEVCRKNLLFEIELDAAKAVSTPDF